MKSCGNIPLVSPVLYWLSVWRAASRAATGDIPAVRDLAGVFCTSPDPVARDIARQGLVHLHMTAQVDAFCRESILRDSPDLLALAIACGYHPAAPEENALWRFCSSRAEELSRTGADDFSQLLAAGYRNAPATVRARARAAARGGSLPLLARSLAGPRVTTHAGNWSYDEWEIVAGGLADDGRWDDLWRLVPLAPPRIAFAAAVALKDAGWGARGDDCLLWTPLVESLPDRWTPPGPAGEPRAPSGRPAGHVVRTCFSPDGSLFVTGSRDGIVAAYRTSSAGTVAGFSAGPGPLRFLAVSAGNTRLVYGGDDGAVHGYSLQDHCRSWSWEGRGKVSACSLANDQNLMVGDGEGRLNGIEVTRGTTLFTLSLRPSPVTCIAQAPSGMMTAVGHADGSVSVVNPADPASLRVFPGRGSPVRNISFVMAGAALLIVYEQSFPALWDCAGGRVVRHFTGFTGRISCSAVSAECGWFAAGGDDNTLRWWDLARSSPMEVMPLYSRRATCSTCTPDGCLLAVGFHDGTVRLYRMPGGGLLREFKAHRKAVGGSVISPDGARLATVSWDGTAKLWRIPGAEITRTLDADSGTIVALAGPAGSLIVTVTVDGIAHLIDGQGIAPERTIDLYSPRIRAAALSPDGTYLASAGADGTLRCWTIRDGGLAAAGDRHASSFFCCTFLPDGSALVAAGWDGSCRLFSIPDLRLLQTLTGHTSTVTCCAVSSDRSLLVTGSNDTTVRIWRLADGGEAAVINGSCSEVGAIALSPDETLIAAGSADGVIRLFLLPYGTPAGELPGLPGKVTALAFMPDGCLLAAGYDHGACMVLSIHERAALHPIPAHAGAVTGITVLSDGRTLVTAGEDGMVRFHHLPLMSFPAGLPDMVAAESGETAPGRGPDRRQRTFLRALITARFHGEIGVCPPGDVAGSYDIQIAG